MEIPSLKEFIAVHGTTLEGYQKFYAPADHEWIRRIWEADTRMLAMYEELHQCLTDKAALTP